jgi:1-acyl-sn-glycerol-3-phosphate acyltransferase
VEHVPLSGPFIVAANHLSFMDPPFIGAVLPRPIHYFARESLFRKPFSSWLMYQLQAIPINRDGQSDVQGMKRLFKVLQEGKGLLIFVEGTRSQDGEMQPVKAGVGMLACKMQVPILPTRIWGSQHVLPRSNRGFNIYARPSIAFGPLLKPVDYDKGKDAKDRYEFAAQKVAQSIIHLERPKAFIL